MRFDTTEDRDTTMLYGVDDAAKRGFARVGALMARLTSRPEEVARNG